MAWADYGRRKPKTQADQQWPEQKEAQRPATGPRFFRRPLAAGG